MEYLNREHIGKMVIIERKYDFERVNSYKTVQKQSGKIVSRIKRFVEDNNVPKYADIIETQSGFVFVKPNDYEFA